MKRDCETEVVARSLRVKSARANSNATAGMLDSLASRTQPYVRASEGPVAMAVTPIINAP